MSTHLMNIQERTTSPQFYENLETPEVYGIYHRYTQRLLFVCESEDLAGTDFSEQDLIEADLSNLCLESCSFAGATLIASDLRQADLRNANFLGADLSLAKIDGALLQGAIYDETTVWPLNFSPESNGCRRQASMKHAKSWWNFWG
ncbi:Hypothetical protein PBC10988_35500 [Planctomycetales bacterium 10988]|nr:Hypothetical protein PBC10988_35500 [Planctomycetales bacterium 10988]